MSDYEYRGLIAGLTAARTESASFRASASTIDSFNVAVGANYGYLVRKPSSGSLLDLLGPWPGYVFGAMALLLIGWALIFTLPWELAARRARSRSDADVLHG